MKKKWEKCKSFCLLVWENWLQLHHHPPSSTTLPPPSLTHSSLCQVPLPLARLPERWKVNSFPSGRLTRAGSWTAHFLQRFSNSMALGNSNANVSCTTYLPRHPSLEHSLNSCSVTIPYLVSLLKSPNPEGQTALWLTDEYYLHYEGLVGKHSDSCHLCKAINMASLWFHFFCCFGEVFLFIILNLLFFLISEQHNINTLTPKTTKKKEKFT